MVHSVNCLRIAQITSQIRTDIRIVIDRHPHAYSCCFMLVVPLRTRRTDSGVTPACSSWPWRPEAPSTSRRAYSQPAPVFRVAIALHPPDQEAPVVPFAMLLLRFSGVALVASFPRVVYQLLLIASPGDIPHFYYGSPFYLQDCRSIGNGMVLSAIGAVPAVYR